MDPLTALSVAGTIVQFVDYGTRLLSNARELYKSSAGTLDANNELELVTTDLQALITKLRASVPLSEDQGDGEPSSFETLCDEAAKVAEELLGRLDKLKNKKETHKIWHSLQKAEECEWSKKEIGELKTRLIGFREALETTVLFSIRYDEVYIVLKLD
jgi:hypothetical protein